MSGTVLDLEGLGRRLDCEKEPLQGGAAGRRGHLCIRTVELFWFRDRRFLPEFDRATLRKIWLYEVRSNRLLFAAGVWELVGNKCHRRLRGEELREQINVFHRHPGRWDLYVRDRREHYAKSLARFRAVDTFWRNCPRSARHFFLRCVRARFFKPPEAYPDYFVVFKTGKAPFVEVKGARESIRPSQHLFFPVLTQTISQPVLIARIEPRRNKAPQDGPC